MMNTDDESDPRQRCWDLLLIPFMHVLIFSYQNTTFDVEHHWWVVTWIRHRFRATFRGINPRDEWQMMSEQLTSIYRNSLWLWRLKFTSFWCFSRTSTLSSWIWLISRLQPCFSRIEIKSNGGGGANTKGIPLVCFLCFGIWWAPIFNHDGLRKRVNTLCR